MRLELIGALPVFRVESTKALGIRAAELKALYQLSVADAWIAALASEQDATLVHKDPEFEQLEGEIAVVQLPYKSTSD